MTLRAGLLWAEIAGGIIVGGVVLDILHRLGL